MEVNPITGGITMVIDNRFWVPGFLAMSWIHHFKSLLFSKNPRICDLTTFVHRQLILQTYQARNDIGEFESIVLHLRRWAINAAVELASLVGPESVVGAESLFMLIWDGTRSFPPQTWIKDSDVEEVLNSPISAKNFYFKIKLIDAWQHSLRARDMVDEAAILILTWLHKFLSCDSDLSKSWDFARDPVLDLLEFAIKITRKLLGFKVNISPTSKRNMALSRSGSALDVELECSACDMLGSGSKRSRFSPRCHKKRWREKILSTPSK
jgi:hypothetical protein